MTHLFILIGLIFFTGCQSLPLTSGKKNERQIQLEILGKKGQVILSKKVTINEADKLMQITTKAMDESNVRYKTEVLCGELGLSEVENLKTEELKTGKNSLKSYGWCYFVDDQLFEIVPEKFDMQKLKHKLTWAYSYSEKRKNEWVGQCVKD